MRRSQQRPLRGYVSRLTTRPSVRQIKDGVCGAIKEALSSAQETAAAAGAARRTASLIGPAPASCRARSWPQAAAMLRPRE